MLDALTEPLYRRRIAEKFREAHGLRLAEWGSDICGWFVRNELWESVWVAHTGCTIYFYGVVNRGRALNLYLIRRKADRFIADTFAYAIVAAETGKAAKHIHPTKGVTWGKTMWMKGGRDYGFDIWTNPSNLRSRLIGVAVEGTLAGMVCTSFN